MKPKLIILSDLWGKKKSDWVAYYIKELQDHFVLQYYDCCELGALDTSTYTEENLHKQFTNRGIDRAVQNLLTLEKGKIHILDWLEIGYKKPEYIIIIRGFINKVTI
ncbi:hypothetical protein IWQ47_003854 [Aquimarina sp. EL_43]|uniref:hypothetical protein n=1 Tax=unclassified Aquimarina TaxID=2627091 RepID=UPI0018CBE35C|nr:MULTISPECIES: hypothetical protein [unclassified Aquimarina]MBG6132629.1 hypothetical protein [Aquimarina sp. EL_35]MBG6152760.1 hypothetical protein [Aquimarina sp. EL_32]MBG6170767.1 hypothetical protein [Aquimarina sp. EL_43]